MRAKLSIGAEGELVFPPRQAEALGLAGGGEADVVTARGAFALVTPARGDEPGAWFAGSLAALTVPEVIQFVFTSLKTGVLLLAFGRDVDGGGAPDRPELLRRKSIYFRDGQVVYASSSDPADRLGPVLVEAGLLPAEGLERCRHLVAAGRPLGQVLVDEGFLTAGQVYEGMTLQVKEILLGAFLEGTGTFAFLEGGDPQGVVRLRERTRDLLLEGVRRVEEAERLAGELGGREVVLAATGKLLSHRPTAAEARLLEAVDGERALVAAAREAGVGLLPALRAAAALVRAGALTPAAPSPAPPSAPEAEAPRAGEAVAGGGPFETYRRILRRVHQALAEAQPDARVRLNSYFDRLPPRQRVLFEGVRVGEDGEVDVARVLANVAATGTWAGAAARARALEALEDLLAFALFEVKNCLPRPAADALLREVGRMQVGKA